MTAPNPEPPDRFYGYAGYPEQAPAPPEPTLRYPIHEQRIRTPRPGRLGRRLLIAAVVIVALLIAADRIGVVVTENVMASQIKTQQNLSQKPGVSISGFPFLTQVISRDFGHVAVDIRGVQVSGGLQITDIHADLNGVHVSSGYNSATVDTLTATAILSYADLSKAISDQVHDIGQVTVSQGTGGQLKATYDLLGATASAEVSVTLLPANTIELKSAGVDAGTLGNLVSAVTPTNFDIKIPLGGLPFGIQLKSLVTTASAVDIVATGQNVKLSQTGVSK